MIGIRFHGRGGQGAVVASKILANAYFSQGLYVQSFPSFGMERKGAAVAAFVRLDTEPIIERGEIEHPAVAIVLDATLTDMVDVTSGLKPGGLILINDTKQDPNLKIKGDYRLAAVDANRIAADHGLGSKTAPIVNTVILGAFAKIAGDLDLNNLIAAIQKSVPVKPEQNMAAAKAAYNHVFWISGETDGI